MRADIIRIGNSKGLRIPKAFLEQCGMTTTVNLRVENHSLVVTPYGKIRDGWEKKFQQMSKSEDESPLDADAQIDESEWEW